MIADSEMSLMQADLWPSDVVVRRFYRRNNRGIGNTSSDVTAADREVDSPVGDNGCHNK